MTEWSLTAEGCLLGRIGFKSFAPARAAGEARIRAAAEDRVEFDCSGLSEANSVAVALLIAWQRAARHCDKAVVFRGASRGLRNIVDFSGLNEILTFE